MNIIAIMGPPTASIIKTNRSKNWKPPCNGKVSRPSGRKIAPIFCNLSSIIRGSAGLFLTGMNSVDLCSDINCLNEYLPLYAFINAHSTMDVSSQDLRMTLWFFEYALGLAEEIATRIGQYTREYLDNITPPFTKALFNYVQGGKYTFVPPGHMGGSAYQKKKSGGLSVL